MTSAKAPKPVWDTGREIMVIECFQENPFLWDNTNGNYFKKNMRNTKLQELCQNLGLAKNGIMFTEEDVKMKWKILRGSFVRELKKVDAIGHISTSGSGLIYASHSRWQHFDRLAFLRDYLRPRNGWSSEERFHQDSDGSPVVTPETRPASRTCRRDSMSEGDLEPLSVVPLASVPVAPAVPVLGDAEDVFGQHVAFALRRLPLYKREMLKLEVQRLIVQFLFSGSEEQQQEDRK
uniref:uncharacterized protein n=1 Tax=Myxine glutinosa TaxID=7769 RepID=UPI00358F0F0E